MAHDLLVAGADIEASRLSLLAQNRELEEQVAGRRQAEADRDRVERERLEVEVHLRHVHKLEAVGQLAGGIAHEINTPAQFLGDNVAFLKASTADLVATLESISRLERETRAGADDDRLRAGICGELQKSDLAFLATEVPSAFTQTLEGIGRITRIVRAIKEFTGPGSGQREFADLNQAIETTVIVCQNRWSPVAELVTELDGSLPLVPCVIGDINQVVLNLILNAVDSIEEARAGDPSSRGRILIRTRAERDLAVIEVSDDGVGIADHVREHLFEPFFTTKEVGQGTGEGLCLAHRIVVKDHGGTIGTQSQTGPGALFTIRLPLGESSVEARSEAA
jgi:signal transduction histidine kinase